MSANWNQDQAWNLVLTNYTEGEYHHLAKEEMLGRVDNNGGKLLKPRKMRLCLVWLCRLRDR